MNGQGISGVFPGTGYFRFCFKNWFLREIPYILLFNPSTDEIDSLG